MSTVTIWVDGDGAPKACKEIAFRASQRTGVALVLVANRQQYVPSRPTIRFVQVGAGFDVADDHIAQACRPDDLVITSDIPLAARVVDLGATVISFHGEELDAENVRERLSVRDFMDDLRSAGTVTGGPPPYGPKDKQRFANALDRWLTAKHR